MSSEYNGTERRRYPASMKLEPSSGWVSRVTLPFVLALAIQGGGVIWWASSLSAKVESNTKSHDQLVQLIRDLKEEVKENRRTMRNHIINDHSCGGSTP